MAGYGRHQRSSRKTPQASAAGGRIFYDQLGGGHSEQPSDTTLWRIERFVDELARVRRALGLKEIHLYGHSWGTIVATEYMLTHPASVRSLILASPAISIPALDSRRR